MINIASKLFATACIGGYTYYQSKQQQKAYSVSSDQLVDPYDYKNNNYSSLPNEEFEEYKNSHQEEEEQFQENKNKIISLKPVSKSNQLQQAREKLAELRQSYEDSKKKIFSEFKLLNPKEFYNSQLWSGIKKVALYQFGLPIGIYLGVNIVKHQLYWVYPVVLATSMLFDYAFYSSYNKKLPENHWKVKLAKYHDASCYVFSMFSCASFGVGLPYLAFLFGVREYTKSLDDFEELDVKNASAVGGLSATQGKDNSDGGWTSQFFTFAFYTLYGNYFNRKFRQAYEQNNQLFSSRILNEYKYISMAIPASVYILYKTTQAAIASFS